MLENLRNIGIIAHVDAGKTTTTERILYYSGTKHKVGDVDDGDTTTDFDPAERARGITINSAAVSVEWGDTQINIIDTPGHVDFTAEVERSLRVLDGAVGVFCAKGGVEVQSETVWRQANKYGVPRIAYINKLDRDGADFYDTIEQMKHKLQAIPAICTIPVGLAKEFKGVIDLVRMKFVQVDEKDRTHVKYDFVEIPEAYREEAELRRHELLETASLASDELAECLIEEKPVSEEMLRAALRAGTLAMKFTPIHCGSSKLFQGVQLLLDAVVDYLPSPLDRGAIECTVPKKNEKVTRLPDEKQPFAGLAFKTVTEPTGDLVYVRIYSGRLVSGEMYTNTTLNRTERPARILRMMGDKRESLESAGPGEIVAVTGLKQTYTGHTLCDEGSPVALESIVFPKPVIQQALIPDRTTDEAKLGEALNRLTRDDPTLRAHTDEETKQLIISGMGELHLEISVEKLMRFPGVKVSVGKPMVAYRQTLAKSHLEITKYVKQTGGRGKFAHVHVQYKRLTPEEIEVLAKEAEEAGEKPDPNNIYFKETIFGGVVSKEYIPSVEAGIRAMAVKGARYGFPCVDILATLVDGKMHDVDSSQDAFKLAGQENFRDAQVNAGIILLEPIMKVVVVTPKDYQGAIAGDINRRRGMIEELTEDKGICTVQAKVPLAKLFGYTTDLRGATSGTASFSMEFSHYAEVKPELADLPPTEKK